VINPGLGDLFLRSDYERMLDTLKRNETAKVFLEPATFRFSDQSVHAVLTAFYDVVDTTNPDVWLLQKKKPGGESAPILGKSGSDVFHETLSTDAPKRFSYAIEGLPNLGLSDPFSVEIVFKPAGVPNTTMTNWATLVATGAPESRMV